MDMTEAIAKMPPEIAAAIVTAQGAILAVGKDAKNTHHGYKYASAEAVIGEGRGALNKAGLALMQIGWHFMPDPEPPAPVETNQGKFVVVGQIGRVFVEYRLLHASGQCLDFETSTPVIPEKGRPEDKAEATALTYNLGYTLRGLLLIPRGDEDEHPDARDDREYQPRARAQAPARQAAPAPQRAHEPGPSAEELELIERTAIERAGQCKSKAELDELWRETAAGPLKNSAPAFERFKATWMQLAARFKAPAAAGA